MSSTTPMKAEDFLRQGADVLAERGKDYDQPEGERSMGRTVRAFNAITGRDLTEAEGWLLMQVLKDVRQWQNTGRYHADSAIDGVNYSALKAEALSNQSLKEDIAQAADNYEPPFVVNGKPDWKDAPDWATHIVERLGLFEFAMCRVGQYWDGPSSDDARFLFAHESPKSAPWSVVESRP